MPRHMPFFKLLVMSYVLRGGRYSSKLDFEACVARPAAGVMELDFGIDNLRSVLRPIIGCR
jgi:hypothetical protein